jgi:hypothetical protein
VLQHAVIDEGERLSIACGEQEDDAKIRSRFAAVLILGPANNPQQSWGFDGEPPEAVIKESGTTDGTL